MSSLSVPSLLEIASPFAVVPAWLGLMFEASTKAATSIREELERMFTENLAAVTDSAAVVLMQLSATMMQALPAATPPQLFGLSRTSPRTPVRAEANRAGWSAADLR